MIKRKAALIAAVSLFFSLSICAQSAFSFKVDKVTVKKAVTELKASTGYSFVYQTDDIDTGKTVSVNAGDINAAVRQILSGQNLDYEIQGKTVIVRKAGSQAPAAAAGGAFGIVKDENGAPVPGAGVVVAGTSNGAVTAMDGSFSIGNVAPGSPLEISCVGYQTITSVWNGTPLAIVLAEDSELLEEVVVVGYGTMKKVDLTGSIARADISAVKTAPNTNILEAIKGQIPGLSIGQSYNAGAEPEIDIRGQITLSGNTSPLIVLDGVVYNGNITDLNPSDIASIDVLKDASSKAVYGARGANGVVMITSKGGGKEKTPAINYSNNFSWSTPTRNFRSLTRDEFLKKTKDVCWQDAYTESSGYLAENSSWTFENHAPWSPAIVDGYLAGTDYDWYDNLTRTGHLHTNTVNISGGTKKASYFVSGSYTDQGTTIINDDYNRVTFRTNLDVQVTDWLKVGTNNFLAFTDYSGVCPSMSTVYLMPAIVSPYDETGAYISRPTGAALVNPYLSAESDDSDKRNQINTTAYALISFPFLEGLTYRANYNYTRDNSWHSYFNKYEASDTGDAFKNYSTTTSWLFDNILNYNRTFDRHSVDATLVYGANSLAYDFGEASSSNFANMTLGYNALAQGTIQTVDSDAWEESSLYQMARFAYNYDSRYYFTATVRRDGFSGFSENHKFGIFPSVGLGWTISREPWMQGAENWLDNLKLRASWGKTGNQTSRYSTLAKVSISSEYAYVFGDGGSMSSGSGLSSMANNELKWETTSEINAGFDFSMWDGRLYGNFDLYNSSTTGLLWNVSLPIMTGFESIMSNLGEINNKGIEFAIGGTPVKTGDFEWNVNLNFASNKNKIVSLLGEDNDGDGKEDDLISSGLFIGESIGTIYGYEVEGIWQIADKTNGTIMDGFEPGSYKIKDQNNDGKITLADDRVVLGHTEPAFTMGIKNQLKWKGLDFNFFINIVNGGKNGFKSYNSRPTGLTTTSNASQSSWMNCYDYWSPSNTDAVFSDAWALDGGTGAELLQSRSFVRLQDISLGYTFSGSWMQKLKIKGLRTFVSGKNLLTFTKWNGWDPESGIGISTLTYPAMKTFAFGVDLTL